MSRRAGIFALLLIILVCIPLIFYVWARNNGRATPINIPGLGRSTPEGVAQGRKPVNVRDLQNMPTGLIDPMTDDDCFFENAYTCLYNNVSTTAGTLEINLVNTARPDTRLSLGLFWGYAGALQQHYQIGIANGGSDANAINSSVKDVLDQGVRNKVNPMMLLAFYDFAMAEARAQNIPPQELGLPLSDAFPFTPKPADVASTFRIALQLFPEETDVFGMPLPAEEVQTGIQDDDLSAWLRTQELSQSGRAFVYATTQLLGSKFASQAFTQPAKFYNHYNMIFRDPRLSGTFQVQASSEQFNPFAYLSRPTTARELVLCEGQRAISCGYVFDETTQRGEAQLGGCAQTPFFDYYCSTGDLLPAP